MQVDFRVLAEDAPGPQWQAAFGPLWPGYRAWFLRGDMLERPSYLASRRALRQHMPELVPTWEALVRLAGGDDVASRFLSLWCPPAYIAGCSQAVWIDAAGKEPPALLRNYDYAPALLEGQWMATRWCGQQVLAMSDCGWGALDGLNESGLAASLSFGGRTVSGEGFGIPLVLRYLLEVAQSTPEAVRLLQRLPVSQCYSVTLLDRRGDWATVFVAPDRPTEVTQIQAVANIQHRVWWPEHARATQAVERQQCLQQVVDSGCTLAEAEQALLQPPLYQAAWERGYGTLYGAAYRPQLGEAALSWPGGRWRQQIAAVTPGERTVHYSAAPRVRQPNPHINEVPTERDQ